MLESSTSLCYLVPEHFCLVCFSFLGVLRHLLLSVLLRVTRTSSVLFMNCSFWVHRCEVGDTPFCLVFELETLRASSSADDICSSDLLKTKYEKHHEVLCAARVRCKGNIFLTVVNCKKIRRWWLQWSLSYKPVSQSNSSNC